MEFLVCHLLITHFSLLSASCSVSCSLPLPLLAVCCWEVSLANTAIKVSVCGLQL